MATQQSQAYAARLEVDHPDRLDRVSTFLRLIWVIPISIILSLLTASTSSTVTGSPNRARSCPDRSSPAVGSSAACSPRRC